MVTFGLNVSGEIIEYIIHAYIVHWLTEFESFDVIDSFIFQCKQKKSGFEYMLHFEGKILLHRQ